MRLICHIIGIALLMAALPAYAHCGKCGVGDSTHKEPRCSYLKDGKTANCTAKDHAKCPYCSGKHKSHSHTETAAKKPSSQEKQKNTSKKKSTPPTAKKTANDSPVTESSSEALSPSSAHKKHNHSHHQHKKTKKPIKKSN